MSSLEKCLFMPSAYFLIESFGFLNTELNELFIYLGINPLSSISIANIFSHSVGCPFATCRLFFFLPSKAFNLN